MLVPNGNGLAGCLGFGQPEGLHACLVPNSFWAVDLFTQNVDND